MGGWKNMDHESEKFTVVMKSGALSLLKDIEASGGSATSDGGIICLEKSTNAWIMIDRNDMRICNRINDCENGLDEHLHGKDCQRDDSEQLDIATRVDEEKPKTPPTQHDPTQSKPNTSGPTVLTPIKKNQ